MIQQSPRCERCGKSTTQHLRHHCTSRGCPWVWCSGRLVAKNGKALPGTPSTREPKA